MIGQCLCVASKLNRTIQGCLLPVQFPRNEFQSLACGWKRHLANSGHGPFKS